MRYERKPRTRRVGLAILLLAATGCYEHTYTVGAGAPLGPVVYSEWQNQWLGGLIGERNLVIEEVCPSGNATIHDEQSFLNGLVGALTSGIYTPTTVTIRCDTGRAIDVALEEEEIRDLVLEPAFIDRVELLLPHRTVEAARALDALSVDRQD